MYRSECRLKRVADDAIRSIERSGNERTCERDTLEGMTLNCKLVENQNQENCEGTTSKRR